ncbi:MAG: hypothetical protein ACREGD_04160 [Candidatus Saccharimonadales bacterium]
MQTQPLSQGASPYRSHAISKQVFFVLPTSVPVTVKPLGLPQPD